MNPIRMGRALALSAITLLAGALGLAEPARALTGDWFETDHGRARLIAATDGTGGATGLRAGLEFEMAPGWKIYWRNPGDAGYPPRLDWGASENLADATMLWPAPERFAVLGLQTLGYKDRVVLPLDILVARPDQPVRLRATLDYLTCDDICIPYTGDIALDIPAGGGALTDQARAIDQGRAQVPTAPEAAGLGLAGAALMDAGEDAVRLEVTLTSEIALVAPDLFVEGPDGSWFDAPEIERAADGRAVRLVATGGGADARAMRAQGLTLTVVDGPRAAEIAVTPGSEPLPALGGAGLGGLLGMLAIAFLGGLILNLMPCVLPVLSLKLASVLGQGGQGRAAIRAGFLASAAGIVVSFLVIAGGLIALKQGGAAIGWGIQFQQPVFLAFMLGVTMLFAFNLLGLFEITLPGRATTALAGIGAPDGQEVRGGKALGGHFLTGVFATLLATPCSAPFLGTAVGFALARGPAEILAVFAALGLGLAAPYLAVAAFPGVARALPRPGPWFVWLKRVLALALIGTAIWLGSVIAVQAGLEAALILAVFVALMGGFLLLRRIPGSRLGRRAGVMAGLVLVAMTAYPLTLPAGGSASGERGDARADIAAADEVIAWQPFDPDAIPGLVASGNAVFVDVTADWCITCQFNKVRVLARPPVSDWLNAPGVVAMKADWTLPDARIAAYLEGFGRYGIPFNVIYGPDAPFGLPLPELLTTEAVREAAARAGGGQPALATR